MGKSATWTLLFGSCFCSKCEIMANADVQDSWALACQRKRCCIRQVLAATKAGVHNSRALFCHRKHCCVRQVHAVIKVDK